MSYNEKLNVCQTGPSLERVTFLLVRALSNGCLIIPLVQETCLNEVTVVSEHHYNGAEQSTVTDIRIVI